MTFKYQVEKSDGLVRVVVVDLDVFVRVDQIDWIFALDVLFFAFFLLL